MKTNVSLLFYQKKPKNYQNGPVPVYLRITVNGEAAEVSTGRSCLPERWNAGGGRDSGTTEAARSLNAYLDCLQARVHEAHRALLEGYEPVTAQSFKNKLLGRTEKPPPVDRMHIPDKFETQYAIETFEEHNRKIEALVGQEYSPSRSSGIRPR